MTRQSYESFDTPEHQELVTHAHSLIARIASKPGATKLLKGAIAALETYASYKGNRRR